MVTVGAVKSPLRTLVIGFLGLAAVVLSACQDDDPAPAPSPTASSTGSPSTDDSQSATESPTESATPTSGVSPAAGPELHLRVMSVHAPEDFKADDGQVSSQEISASSNNGLLQLIEIEGAADVPLDVSAENFVKSIQGAKDLKRLPNVFLGQYQVESLRFEWTDKGTGDHFDSVLANYDGVAASLSFSVSAGRHRSEPDLFDSVLASVQWLV